MSSLPSKKVLPWHTKTWEELMQRKEQNYLPHALLFVGAEGLGKAQFSLAFAQALLCNKPNAPCNECHACHLLNADSHPDLMLLSPEGSGQMIKIDQIREMVKFMNETALQNVMRIVIINPASAMNINAANALLKTLEEPPKNTLILLINNQSLRLPATVLSRCQKVLFKKPEQAIGLNWLQSQQPNTGADLALFLKMANGAPLLAQELISNGVSTLCQDLYQGLDLLAQGKTDPLQLAAQCQDQDSLLVLKLLMSWLQDFLAFKLTKGEAKLVNNHQDVFLRLAPLFSCEKLLNYFDHTKKIYGCMLSSLNLNRQLVLEDLFIRWTQHATG